MKGPVYLSGAGAVTAAGLDARQTLAAIRAGLSAVETMGFYALDLSQAVARIPAHYALRNSEADWLLNMAARAILEALASGDAAPEETLLLVAPPESFRNHPLYDTAPASVLMSQIIARTGRRFHPASRGIDGGAAASAQLLARAAEALAQGSARQAIVGGVDSLINERDLARLLAANRLQGADNAQGLVPGEGAVFLRLTASPEAGKSIAVAVMGAGLGNEADTVLGERNSQGRALLQALSTAVANAGAREADLGFVVSNGNGERYSAWEQMICHPRFYRTRRGKLVVAYPAMTVGEIGAAAGALALMLAADSFVHDYAPAPIAMCELASEAGMRAGIIVARGGGR
jgi:3-oxoacyl-[acyl-carrier-protein] synthase-1